MTLLLDRPTETTKLKNPVDARQDRVGFTGTRQGLVSSQAFVLRNVLQALYGQRRWFHHGDCVGADAAAHRLAGEVGYRTVSHPPTIKKYRAYCTVDVEMEPLPYMQRNLEIVRASGILVACPEKIEEELRSGTWATVRMARKLSRSIILIYPSGRVDTERFDLSSL